ncbi:MAG: 4-alpha-glucanotransferase, partial [Muribaculaceae bacterium]|nr:4-alpha-glucanotransferase [Muribaculaceae bacterium]
MKLTFNIHYKTTAGQHLAVAILSPINAVLRMEPSGNDNWHATTTINEFMDSTSVTYRYSVVNDCDMTTAREEYGTPHSIDLTDRDIKQLTVTDRWSDAPPHKPFYAQAFTRCINRRRETSAPVSATPGRLLIKIDAPEVSPDETLVMTGSCDILGNWNPELAPEMNDALFPTWQLSIPVDALSEDIEYKMVTVKKSDRQVVKWEEGSNRYLSKKGIARADATVIGGLIFNQEHSTWRGTGVAIPVFSLRSDEDWGVGDFHDLIRLTDWAKATGQQFIQILPINDTTMTGTWMDSYPY